MHPTGESRWSELFAPAYFHPPVTILMERGLGWLPAVQARIRKQAAGGLEAFVKSG